MTTRPHHVPYRFGATSSSPPCLLLTPRLWRDAQKAAEAEIIHRLLGLAPTSIRGSQVEGAIRIWIAARPASYDPKRLAGGVWVLSAVRFVVGVQGTPR